MPFEIKTMITEFSFKNKERLGQDEYVIAVRDTQDRRNIYALLHYGETLSQVAADTSKVCVIPNNRDYNTPNVYQNFPNVNELIRVEHSVVENMSPDPKIPKWKTFHDNLKHFDENELIEIFEGTIDESNSIFVPTYDAIRDLLIDKVYTDNYQVFFILTDVDRFVGPFYLDESATIRKLTIKKGDFYPFGEYEFLNDENSFRQIKANNLTRRIIFPDLHNPKLRGSFSFVSDEELIDDFKLELSKEKIFNVEELEKLVTLLKRTSESGSINDYLKRIDRLKELVQDSEKVIIKDKELSNVVSNLDESKKEIEELKNKRDELDSEVRKLGQIKLDIEQQTQSAQKEKDIIKKELVNIKETKEKELEKQKSELDEVINTLKESRSNLEAEIESEREKLKQDFDLLKENIKEKEIIRTHLSQAIQTLQSKFIDVQKDAQTELMNLIENKTYFDFLSGRDISSYKEIDDSFKDYRINSSLEIETFKKEIIEQLETKNRKYSKHFIDNLLISIHQNTLTILAGLPGTGKTSLARILLNTLTSKERICEVSVNRGWVSQKDLIGFFNPLSKRFHASNTGIYDLLKQLDYEAKQDWFEDSPMSYIILDEANLSPIEHYWSCFYNLTDATARTNRLLEINLGGNESIKYANNLRFIGTINYDQTTESLSPRVLDRANIIQIPDNEFSITEITDTDIETIDISYKKLREFYRLQDFSDERMSIAFDNDTEGIFNEVRKLFKELSISISPRLEIAIQRYCLVARKLMKEKNKPIDYCIAQRLLPKIVLQGDDARKKLNKLKDYLDDKELTVSSDILKGIIKHGKEGMFEDNYDYFLTLSHV